LPGAAPGVMDTLVSLCKRRGFVFQSSEIYWGLVSVWEEGSEPRRKADASW